MAKIIQILDVNSDGHRLRLDNGGVVLVPHGTGQDLNVGDELKPWGIRTQRSERAPSLEFLNSPQQVQANILSEVVLQHDKPGIEEFSKVSGRTMTPEEQNYAFSRVGEHEDASSEPSAAGSDGDSGAQPVEIEAAK